MNLSKLDAAAMDRLVGLFKRQILASPLNSIVELFVWRRENAAFTKAELLTEGWNVSQLEKARWIRYDAHRKRWMPFGELSDKLYFEYPKLDPVFTEIRRPAGASWYKAGQRPIIEVIDAPDGGKISLSNIGIVRREIPFSSGYRLNRIKFGPFLDCLAVWVHALEDWRMAAITPPFTKAARLANTCDKARMKFLQRYNNVAAALWIGVPQFNPGGVTPFFNPVYFPRTSKDIAHFWRLIDLVRRLYNMDPLAETRGVSSHFTPQQYAQIAKRWLAGWGYVKIANEILHDTGETATTRIKRAMTDMGLHRRRKK